ncbi:MAG: S-layer homology domain-containing protein [Clostridia bacterium]|nr:S-layer homology domain-containing protein [Clostridia bacterium]
MKKLVLLLAVLLLVSAFSLSTFALEEKDDSSVANSLYSLGLVKGYDDSGSDFRLANKLTRAEAVVQIIRFLGVEEEALAGEYSLAFDDVPEWALPYVGYAFTNGITSGRSATKFDTNGNVDEAQFLTLLLRAMDYSDKDGDFVWNDPFTLANSVGLIDHAEAVENFTRGDAFVACYNSLESKTKGGKTVSDKLIETSVITKKAYGYAKRIANGETIIVACVGDSITQGTGASPASSYSYPAQLQKLLGQGFKVVNCGKAASYVMDLDSPYNVKAKTPALWYPNTAEYTKYKNSNAEIVIVMLGTNDARSMTDVKAEDDFMDSYRALINDLKSLSTVKEMYLSTMIPAVNADITNQGTAISLPRLIEKMAEELELPLVRTHETLHDYYNVMLTYNDSVHPTNSTYPALAINFYNEVFGHSKALPEIQKAKDNVVFVSRFGGSAKGGTSESDTVNSLGLAVAMLKETGGTVVVCSPLDVKVTYFVEHSEPIVITSVYDGVDYREKNGAVLNMSGNITLGGDTTFDAININATASALAISCRYNDLTIGEDVVCTLANSSHVNVSINAGYRIGSSAITAEDVSCHKDCTISIASGTWGLIRSGNMRSAPGNPIGTIDKGVTLTVNITGGEHPYTGVNATAGIGMNGCEGDVVFNVSGGNFTGGVYGIHRTGSNTTDSVATFGGNITMTVTGGTFAKGFGLYHTADTPKVQGTAKLVISEQYKSVAILDGFDKVEYVD